MPAAIVAVASYAAGEIVAAAVISAGWGTVLAGTLGAVASFTTSAIVGSAMSGGDAPAASAAMEQVARGTLLNTAGTVDPLPVIYGTRRIGGTRVFTESSGATNQYLHLVITHCEGPIQAIDQVYLDGVAVTDAKFAGLVTVEKFLGADDQAACASLMAAVPAKWTAAHRLAGVAYTVIRLTYDATAFPGLPTITADIRGRMVFDPRDSQSKHSANPALCLRDYLTHTRYGRGVPAAQLDDAAFMAAANACEATFTTPAGAAPRHTCNGLVNTDQSAAANVASLLSACRGLLVYSGQGYGLIVDKAEVPTAFQFTEDNIVGAWSISLGSKRAQTNRVRGNWFDPANNWQANIWVADSPTDRTADNGLMLERQIELPFTTSPYEVQVLSERELRQSRFGIAAVFRATIAGTFCEVGDVVPITHSTPGWWGKPFRIVRISLLSSDEVEVEAREYDDAVYSVAPLTAPRVSPASSLPDPSRVLAPSGVALAWGDSSGRQLADGTFLPTIDVSWAAADAFASQYEVQWARDGGDWVSAQTTTTAYAIGPAVIGSAYSVRVRARNGLGAVSPWATADTATYGAFSGVPASLTATAVPGSAVLTQLAWTAVAGAERYLIDQSGDGSTWQRTGETTAITWADSALFGTGTRFRVAAVRGTPGPWSSVAFLSVSYLTFWGDAAAPFWNTNLNTPLWSA